MLISNPRSATSSRAHAQVPVEDSIIMMYKEEFRKAKNAGDTTAISESLNRFLSLKEESGERKWLVNHYIGYILMYQTYFIYGDDKKREAVVDRAIGVLNESLDQNRKSSDTYVLLAALYNNKIDIHQDETEIMLELVAKRDELMKKARRLDKKNPRYFLIKGQSLYYTPVEFGGGLLKAKKEFEQGLKLFPDEQEDSVLPDWGRTDLLNWLGYIAEEQEDLELAINYYETLLSYEPEYKYVRDTLLPKLKIKHRNSKN